MKTYPICLVGMERRRVVVVGGGRVAERRVAGLLEAEAQVTVIGPWLTPQLHAWAKAGRLVAIERDYRAGDLAGAFLVIAATDDPAVNRAACAEAEAMGCLINSAAQPALGNCLVPAVVRRGEITIAISTGGASPALARHLRRRLEETIGAEYAGIAALLGELRPALLARFSDDRARAEAVERLLGAGLPDLLRDPGDEQAKRRALQMLEALASPDATASATAEAASDKQGGAGLRCRLPWIARITEAEERGMNATLSDPGIVYLVGAGPGDPGLITVRGMECLQRAGVVIYDRLANPALLAYASDAELIDVGKDPNHAVGMQSRINDLLIAHAWAGKVVVRLKGGDPFVFGRGGEEAEALVEAGIRFEVVPGVSSAVAAPAYAGIPVTHRDLACSFSVIAGHRAAFVEDPACDWRRLAQASDTLVFLMGVKNLPHIVDAVLAAGRPALTPVALIERASGARQRTVVGTLETITGAAADVEPPAVIVIGEVVRLREKLAWYGEDDGRGERP